MLSIVKILTPKVIKGIMKYVFEENDLDMQMESARERLDIIEKKLKPGEDYIACDKCKRKIKQYEGTD